MTTFTKGDRITLKTPRLCYVRGETTTMLLNPSDVLKYVTGNDKHCFFEVVGSGVVVKITRTSFENLTYKLI